MYSLRLANGGSGTGLGLALFGRFGGRRGGCCSGAVVVGGAPAPTSLLATRGRGRSASATPNAAAPTPRDQGAAMEEQRNKPQPQPRRDADAAATEQGGTGTHKATTAHGDVMSHSFGDGYATRSEEEGFGGVYGRNDDDPVFNPRTDVHPSHPEYDVSQGSEVKEKEKARHHKDHKHGT